MRALLVVTALVLAGCFGATPEETNETETRPGPTSFTPPADPILSGTGQWQAPFEGEVAAINMVLLHTGDVLYWSGVDAQEGTPADVPFLAVAPYPSESRVLHLGNMTLSEPGVPEGIDLFCSGQTILPDGRVLTGGGTEYHAGNQDTIWILDGLPDARIFDPATGNWSVAESLNIGRWYPTLYPTASGDPVAASGIGRLTNPSDHWPNMETFRLHDHSWHGVEAEDQLLPLYPRMFQVAGGPLKGDHFYAGNGALWTPFGEHPQQYEWSWQRALDPETGQWTQLERTVYGARDYSPSVMLALEADRDYAPVIVGFGGALYQSSIALPVTEITDLSTDPPTLRAGANMAQGRWHNNGVLLPDNTVLAIGGADHGNVLTLGAPNNPVLALESYDITTDRWTQLAPMSVPRMYHSTAMLLPDATVLVGGHVPLPQEPTNPANPQVVETRLEIYEPGYLFRGERPSILEAPVSIDYDATFDLRIQNNGTLDSIMLYRPGAVTHAFDSNQRAVILEVLSQDGETVTVAAPPDAYVAPPGHYMVFANQAHPDGAIPSEAAWVHLD